MREVCPYAACAERSPGRAHAEDAPQGRNEPGELPRIGEVVAQLRGMSVPDLAGATFANACEALPRLGALLRG